MRGGEKHPGALRDIQNIISERGPNGRRARFVPPPPLYLRDSLDDLDTYMNQPPDMPVLIQLALIHYQFETIHPFEDGNGRIGRLLVTLLLCKRQVLPYPLLYLSAYLERNRDQYMDCLLRVSQTGKWLDWVGFFLKGVEEQSADAVDRAVRLYEAGRRYHIQVQHARSSSLLTKMIDYICSYVAVSIPNAAKVLDVSYKSAQHTLEKLVEQNILQEYPKEHKPKLFYAPEILDILG